MVRGLWRRRGVDTSRAAVASLTSWPPAAVPPTPAGQHRWVEYAGKKNFYMVDASFIAPEWHGWLHHVTDEPPTAVSDSLRAVDAWGRRLPG